jgi:hypothetical protein
MTNKNKTKLSIAIIITFGMIFSTIPIVSAYDPIVDDPILTVEHKINNRNLRSWVLDYKTGNYVINPEEPDTWAFNTKVKRYTTVHFKMVVKNIVDSTIELDEFIDKLPANFNNLTNGQISVNNAKMTGTSDFYELFNIIEEPLSGDFWDRVSGGFSRIIIQSKNTRNPFVEIYPGGTFTVEFDAFASDIISNAWEATAVDNNGILFAPFIRNHVTLSQGTHVVPGTIPASYSVVYVDPNDEVDKKVFDKNEEDFLKIGKAEVGEEVEFAIDFQAPIARDKEPETINEADRDYYFKELTIEDYLPDELEYISCEVDIKGQYVGSLEPTIEKYEKGNKLKWIFMGKISSGHITLFANAKEAGVAKNLVQFNGKITSDSLIFFYQGIIVEPSVRYQDESSAFVVAKGRASLLVDKLVFDETQGMYVEEIVAEPGDKLNFLINVTNNGDYPIEELTAIDQTSDIFVEKGEVWEVGTLGVGETWTKDYSANIKEQFLEPAICGRNTAVAEGEYTYESINPISVNVNGEYIIIEETGYVGQEDVVEIIIEGINKRVNIFDEDPADKSNDVYVGIPEVSVEIEDPDGDSFDWFIKVAKYDGEEPIENGKIPDSDLVGQASGTAEFNGTKVCLVEGLEDLTQYIWMVHAVDSGSTIAKEAYFTFKTSDQPVNETPDICCENPSDGAIDVSLSLTELSVTIEDPESDLFDWSITTSPDIGSASGNSEGDGIKTCTIDCNLLEPLTTYSWTVEATDESSGYSSKETYSFTTEKLNLPPDEPINPFPNDGQNFIEPYVTLEVEVSDPNGDSMDVSFFDGDDNLLGTDTDVESKNKAYFLLEGLEYSTTYYWYTVASDASLSTQSATWSFTTEEDPYPGNNDPDKPVNPSPENDAEDVSPNPTLSVDVSDPDGDALDVYFYDGSDNLIGVDEDVPSEMTAYFSWLDLENDTTYSWYAVANDGKEGITESDVFSFTTGGGIEPEILLLKPLEGMLYLNNQEICPFPTTLIVGAIDINITVTLPVETIKLYIEGEEVASFDYNPLQVTYDYRWEERSLFWKTIKVVAMNGETEVCSYELDVLAFIF